MIKNRIIKYVAICGGNIKQISKRPNETGQIPKGSDETKEN
jgi:hypothetical protein